MVFLKPTDLLPYMYLHYEILLLCSKAVGLYSKRAFHLIWNKVFFFASASAFIIVGIFSEH